MSNLMPLILWVQVHSVIVVTAVFSVLMLFVFWPSRRDVYDHAARLPFDEN